MSALLHITEQEREAIEAEAERYAMNLGAGDFPSRQCVRWAFATAMALRKRGYHACVNAGSAAFRLNDLEGMQQAGNQIEYCWQTARDEFGLWLDLGILPEMHAWAVLPREKLIVDLTVRYREDLAKDYGIEFNMPYVKTLWLDALDPQPGFYYDASEDACVFVHLVFQKVLDDVQ